MKLVLGYGNPTRQDDGVGPALAARVADQGWPGVETLQAQQLGPEMLDEFLKYERVVLVDCATGGPEAAIQKVEDPGGKGTSSSHHTAPEVFVGLARTLYGKPLDLWVCTVRGSDFGFGNKLGADMGRRMERALGLIRECLNPGPA